MPVLVCVALVAGCAGGYQASAPDASEIPSLEAQYRRDPGDVAVGLRLGAAYRVAGRATEALPILESVQRGFPNDPGAVLFLGLTYEDLERKADAIALYERYLEVGTVEEVKDDLRGRIPVLRREHMRQAARAALAREAELAATAPAPRTVAVFPFVLAGNAPTLEPLSRALADMVTTDLSQTDRLSVLERAQVQALVDEMRLVESGLVAEQSAARAGHLLGAGTVVQGRVDLIDEAVRLEALTVPVGRANPSLGRSVEAMDELERLFDLEKELVLGLFDAMSIELTAAERVAVNRRPTESLQALLAYGQGLQAMDAGNFEAAAQAFENAAAIDPGFAQAVTRAQVASSASAAARTSTRDIAQRGGTEAPEPPPALDPIAIITPDLGGRDAGAEILGQEGIGSTTPTTLDVNVSRP